MTKKLCCFLSFIRKVINAFNCSALEKKPHYSYRAAALSFYTLISLIPLMAGVATLLSLIPFSPSEIGAGISRILPDIPFKPDALLKIVDKVLEQGRGIVGFFGFLAAYFCAAKLSATLYRSIHILFETKPDKSRLHWIELLSVPFMTLVVFVVYFGGLLVNIATKLIFTNPLYKETVPALIHFLFIKLANPVTFVAFFLIQFSIYYLFSPGKKRWAYIFWVSFFNGLTFTALKSIFSWFVTFSARINPIYGAFGGLFGFFSWIYLAYMVFLIGARTLYKLESSNCNGNT